MESNFLTYLIGTKSLQCKKLDINKTSQTIYIQYINPDRIIFLEYFLTFEVYNKKLFFGDYTLSYSYETKTSKLKYINLDVFIPEKYFSMFKFFPNQSLIQISINDHTNNHYSLKNIENQIPSILHRLF